MNDLEDIDIDINTNTDTNTKMTIKMDHNSEQRIESNLLPETIYANNTVITCNRLEHSSKRDSVPVGRKPALPPKPPNRAALILGKPKGFVQSARAAIFDKKSPQGKIDPAELTLKERLALFENKTATIPKASLTMSESSKQMKNIRKNNCDHLKMPLLRDISTQKLTIVCQNTESKHEWKIYESR